MWLNPAITQGLIGQIVGFLNTLNMFHTHHERFRNGLKWVYVWQPLSMSLELLLLCRDRKIKPISELLRIGYATEKVSTWLRLIWGSIGSLSKAHLPGMVVISIANTPTNWLNKNGSGQLQGRQVYYYCLFYMLHFIGSTICAGDRYKLIGELRKKIITSVSAETMVGCKIVTKPCVCHVKRNVWDSSTALNLLLWKIVNN